ncbi:PLP-dependent aminotransferase family protein [Clostridium carnis]
MDILTITLNNNSKIPLYEQIYNFIKAEIQKGNIESNCKLPSKRKLAKYLQISLNTVEAAYEQLVAEGYIISKPKKGYFVCEINGFLKSNRKSNKLKEKNNINKISYKYEFLSSRIDLESFPYTIWRKIIKDIIFEENKNLLQIGHSQGDLNLRESIANYIHYSRGVVANADEIVIGAGTEYLFQILINLIGRENIYATENPGYFKIRKILETHGINSIGIDVDNQGVNVDKLRKSKANIIHTTPSHQFPLGIIMPISRRMELLNWAEEKEDRYIIEDDYDSEFRFYGKPIPAMQSLDRNGKVIYIGTFSKCLAPSMRIAYMVLPKSLLEKYKRSFSFYACTVSRIEQQGLCRFIENGYFERHLNKMRNIYKKKREQLVTLIKNNFKNTEIIGTNSGLHLLLKVNNGMSERELIEKAKNAKIKVLGISNSYKGELDNKYFGTIFLGYASLEEENLEEAIILLKSVWFE